MEDDTVSTDESGHIDREMPFDSRPPASPIFFLSGSPTMVAAARRALINAGVDENNIRVEEDARLEHHAANRTTDNCDTSLSNQGISGHGRDF
jgi:ferredoxin-NADP reductase